MPKIFLQTSIKASPETCFNLSLSVDLHRFSMKETREHIVGGVRAGIMGLGDSVTWKALHFGVWQTLTTKITEHAPYQYFADEMTQGAFKSMRHEHYFAETPDGTLMKDLFDFESPFGIIGKLFNILVLENYMTKFLMKRNEVIRKVAESDDWKRFV